jgi:hypothetical protein
MYKDKTIKERKELLTQQYSATMQQYHQACNVKKRAKVLLETLKAQLEVISGLEESDA